MFRSLLTLPILAGVALPMQAQAAVVLPVEMNYANGASFQGDVTFSDDYSQVLDVDGTLYGYAPGSWTYNPGASSAVTWLWANGADFAAGPNNYGTFLMTGTNIFNYGSFVQFAYNFSDAPNLDFTNTGTFQNSVNYSAALNSGGVVGAVPEPASWLLMILGFGGVGVMLRREQRLRQDNGQLAPA